MSELSPIDVHEMTQRLTADQIDLICDAFEAEWTNGQIPEIERYLARCDDASRGALLIELILVDREFRAGRGEEASRESYRSRFPDYSTFIDDLNLATIGDVDRRRTAEMQDGSGMLRSCRISRFELQQQLGCGASGTVWKARDTRLRRIVALKIPRHEELSDAERDRYLREAQATAQLRHSNIVTVYEVGEDEGRVFIVAEYVDGIDLRKWLSEQRPTTCEAAELVAQLGSALHHAHEQGIIHRDLKPANVLIDSEGRPHITDFGLAKWTAGGTGMSVQGSILGTPAYMSPEQARGDSAQVDRRTDVYALGALLYELLSGKPPFAGDVAAIVHQVVHDQPPPPHRVASKALSRDLEIICLRAMDKEPGRRYLTAQAMATDLRRFLRGEPILARQIGIAERAWRQCKRKPMATIAVLLAIIASIGGIALASVIQERDRLADEKFRLEGYQRVEIVTEPSGAVVAIAPVDPVTGGPELDSKKIVRSTGKTPWELYLKPGEYFIEAALFSEGELTGFAEAHRIVPSPKDLSVALKQMYWVHDIDRNVIELNAICIPSLGQVRRDMSLVYFDSEVRQRYSNVPPALWIDRHQSLPGSFTDRSGNVVRNITFDSAVTRLEELGKRLPMAVEFDALTAQIERLASNRDRADIQDLTDEFPEWTSTCLAHSNVTPGVLSLVHDVFVLKGFGERPEGYIWTKDSSELLQPRAGPDRPTAMRGVRSGMPRLIQW